MNLSVQRDCLSCDLSRKNYKDLHVADLSNATNLVMLPTPYYIFLFLHTFPGMVCHCQTPLLDTFIHLPAGEGVES